MFLTELKKYEKYIDYYFIYQYEQNGNNLRFRMTINFKDGSKLYIKEIIIDGSQRKYGYQWVTRDKKLIRRWDNAPDLPNIDTFPHHQHVGSENDVRPSKNVEFATIIKEMIELMQPIKS